MPAKKAPIVISQAISSGIYAVWGNIGSDLQHCCEEAGERLNNEGAIESIIDADRMSFGGHQEAQAELTALIKVHGYDAVFKHLNKNYRLV